MNWEVATMAFFASFVTTVLKMIFITAFAVLGVMTGKNLRAKKNAKQAIETEA